MNTPLPPQGPHGPDDELPEEAGLAALYRKLPQDEPGAALDAAILHAAAQAIAATDSTELPQGERRRTSREPGDWVRPKPHGESVPISTLRAPRASRHRSLVALASAASLVLVAGLAWHMRDMPTAEPAAAPSRAALDSSTAVSEPAAVPASPQITASKPAANGMASQDQAVSPAVGSVEADAAAARAMAARASSPIAQNAVAAPPRLAPAAADPNADSRSAVAAKTLASPLMKDQAIDKQADASRRVAKREFSSHAPTPPAMPAPVAEMSAAPSTQSLVAPAQPPVDEVSAAPAPPPAPSAEPAPERIVGSAPSAGSPATSPAEDVSRTEARELVAIRKLFATHHDDEGLQRLQDFRRLHPQWPLPADLQARLREP